MAAKNQLILEMLEELRFDGATQIRRNKALDDLMQAKNASEFRTALLNNQTILTYEAQPTLYNDAADSDEFLSPAGEGDEAAGNSIDLLRQKAAKRRILFGLQHENCELSHLQEIAKQENSAGVLQQLESKPAIFGDLSASFNWMAAENPILTEDIVGQIKTRAHSLAISKIVAAVAEWETQFNEQNVAINGENGFLNPFKAENVQYAVEGLAAMSQALAELQGFISEQNEFLSIVFAEEDAAQTVASFAPRAEAMTGQLADLKLVAMQKALTFVRTQSELTDVELQRIEWATVHSNALEALVSTQQARLKAINEAIELADSCASAEDAERGTQREEDELYKNVVERALIKLTVHIKAKLAREKLNSVEEKVAEIGRHTGPESERNGMLGQAAALLREAQQAYEDAKAIKERESTRQLYEDFGDAFTEIITLVDDVARNIETVSTNVDAVKIWVEQPATPPHFGNIYLQTGGAMFEYFTDEVVEPGNAPPAGVLKEDALAIAVNRVVQTPKFQRKNLQAGAFIYSTACFPKFELQERENQGKVWVAVPNVTVTARLAQDSSGRVVDRTTDQLTGKQCALKALKQAEMLLTSYTPKDGDTIYITGGGQHTDQANMVLAALLLLRDGNPALKQVKIVSEVPGCIAPEAPVASTFRFWETSDDQATVNRKFIEKYLPSRFVDEDKKRLLQQQVAQFTGAKVTITEQFKTMKDKLRQGRKSAAEGGDMLTSEEKLALARQMQELGFQEDEEIDAAGHRMGV